MMEPSPCCSGAMTSTAANEASFARFHTMIDNCYAYAREAKAAGRPIVGIMCEFAPRELILAANGVPVCLCGGSAQMIEPAEHELPANLCPLIKSTYGYHLRKANPFLEMADFLVAETTCDGKRKMFELLADSRPLHVLELPHNPDDADARESWYHELCKLRRVLEERFHTEITEAKLRAAIRLMNRERRLRRELAELLQAPAPPLTGGQLLQLSSISGIPATWPATSTRWPALRAQPAMRGWPPASAYCSPVFLSPMAPSECWSRSKISASWLLPGELHRGQAIVIGRGCRPPGPAPRAGGSLYRTPLSR